MRNRDRNLQHGQAVLEYILLLAIVVSLYATLVRGLQDRDVLAVLSKPLKTFSYTYRYGHPEARGQNDGGPKLIPALQADSDFRIFINPPIGN